MHNQEIVDAYRQIEQDFNGSRRLPFTGFLTGDKSLWVRCYDELTENGKFVYLTKILEWSLPACPYIRSQVRIIFSDIWLSTHHPEFLYD